MTLNASSLPASCRAGVGVRICADSLHVGDGFTLEDNVTIVGGAVEIGKGTHIGRATDLRAAELRLGERSEIGEEVSVLVAERFEVQAAARIAVGCRIVCRSFTAGRLLYLGDGASVGFGGTTTSTAHIRLGSRVTIGQFAILNANMPIEVGDNVGTGSYLSIWTHGYHFGHGPLNGTQPAYAPVRVGRNVWLGFQVTILPGASIGDDSMIAAGAVVSSDIPPKVLAGGVPAKVKKTIDVSPVSDEIAFESVAHVLRTWHRELLWKGCKVSSEVDGPDGVILRASTEDGTDRILVQLTRAIPVGPLAISGEPLVLLNASEQEYQGVVQPLETVFDLRLGQIRGRRSVLIEDLRDQLRRNAMPCGDDSCFVAIEPEPFARLRAALPAVKGR